VAQSEISQGDWGFLHHLYALQPFEKLPLKTSHTQKMIPKPMRRLATGTAIILGGIVSLNLASTVAIKAIRFTNEAKRVINSKAKTISG
jgi:hypothetical protein